MPKPKSSGEFPRVPNSRSAKSICDPPLGHIEPSIQGGFLLRDDALLAGDCIPHAGSTERVHTFHNHERRLLQGHDAQMVILLLFGLRTHSRPHIIFHLQGLVFPFPHLHRDEKRTQPPQTSVSNLSQCSLNCLQSHCPKANQYQHSTQWGEYFLKQMLWNVCSFKRSNPFIYLPSHSALSEYLQWSGYPLKPTAPVSRAGKFLTFLGHMAVGFVCLFVLLNYNKKHNPKISKEY